LSVRQQRYQGQTFKLLPLAIDTYNAVDAVAVNPIDGRYSYAMVAGSYSYRSSNRGCTWEKLKMLAEFLEPLSRAVP
jgi:hypothetical protein